MAETKVCGEVENVPYEIKHTEWRIPEFFADQEDVIYESPTFFAADASWYVRLRPWSCGESVFIDIYPNSTKDRELTGYCFGIRKCDGTVMEIAHGIIQRNSRCSYCKSFIKKTELLQQKTELTLSNDLTVTCTLKWMTGTSHSAESNGFGKSKSLKLTRLDKLSANFKDLYTDKESCDVILKVKDKEFKAHRLVLMTRCIVFATYFKHDTLERQTGIITISDCDPDSFEEFLKYLYCGKLEELSFRSALNLYYTSDKYDVQELKAFCIDYLKQCLSEENICEVVNFADTYDETALFSAAQDFFNKNINNILNTSEWECFMKSHSRSANKLLKAMPKVKYGE